MTRVGTPGLGYPLLLRLGKSLVVILNYVQQTDPCGPEPCSPNSGPGPVPWLGKVREHHVSREKLAVSPNGRKLRTSHGVRDPPWGPGPLYSNRTPHQGKESSPRLGVVRSRHVSASTDTYIMLLGLHIKAHLPLHSVRLEDARIDVAEAEAIL